MTDQQWRYLAQLTRALEEQGVRGSRIGDHVAEVAAHLEDTNRDPVEEFGPPPVLAASLSQDERLIPAWLRWMPVRVAVMTIALAGAMLLAAAALADPAVITLGGLAYAVGLAVLIVVFRHVATQRLDGRSLTSMITPLSALLLISGAGLVSWISVNPREIAEISRRSALLLGVVAAGIGLAGARLVLDTVRFPDHAPELRRLTRPLSRPR